MTTTSVITASTSPGVVMNQMIQTTCLTSMRDVVRMVAIKPTASGHVPVKDRHTLGHLRSQVSIMLSLEGE